MENRWFFLTSEYVFFVIHSGGRPLFLYGESRDAAVSLHMGFLMHVKCGMDRA
jgi:hypothetical protein